MANATTTNPQQLQVRIGEVPKQGRLTVPFQVDLTNTTAARIDLTAIQQMQNRIEFIQGAFIDNSANLDTVLLTMQNTGQKLQVSPQSQAYLPLVITNQVTIDVSSSGGVIIPMFFFNFAVAPCVWSVNGTPSISGGAVPVSDAVLDSTVVNSAVQTTVTGNKTYTSASGTVTAGGTAQTALAQQLARTAYRFSNLSASVMYINDIGGTAAPTGTDSIEIPAGGFYETQPGLCSTGAISVYSGTTGAPFTLLWA